MRLIDADALGMDMWIQMGILYGEDIGKAFADIVRNAPTIEAEPVVRCKDCKRQRVCKVAQWQGNYGYCSRGERREP